MMLLRSLDDIHSALYGLEDCFIRAKIAILEFSEIFVQWK
jgi:hypothetical protein